MNNLIMEDAINCINEQLLEESIEIDSAYKLKEAVRREKTKRNLRTFKRVSALAACLCICVCAALLLSPLRQSDGNMQTTSPTMSVESVDEMSKYLGFSLPLLASKTATDYYVYSYDGRATFGEIKYADGSSFRMSRGNGDISGITGAKFDCSVSVGSININCYSLAISNISYAVWEDKGFAYCYYSAIGETDVINPAKEIINYIQ